MSNPAETLQPRINSKAIWSFLAWQLGSWLFGAGAVAAIVLGRKAKEEVIITGKRGYSLAAASIVMGWIGLALWAAVVLFMLLVALTI